MKKRAEEIYTSYKKSLSEDYSLSSLAPCLEKTSRFKGRKEVGDKLPLMTEIASKSEVWGMVLAVPALASLLYLVLPLDAIFDFIPFLGLIDDAFVLSLAFSEIRKTMGSYSEGDLDLIYSSLPLSLQREFLLLKEETRVAPLERKIPRKLASVAIRSACPGIVVRKIRRDLFSFSLVLLSLFCFLPQEFCIFRELISLSDRTKNLPTGKTSDHIRIIQSLIYFGYRSIKQFRTHLIKMLLIIFHYFS